MGASSAPVWEQKWVVQKTCWAEVDPCHLPFGVDLISNRPLLGRLEMLKLLSFFEKKKNKWLFVWRVTSRNKAEKIQYHADGKTPTYVFFSGFSYLFTILPPPVVWRKPLHRKRCGKRENEKAPLYSSSDSHAPNKPLTSANLAQCPSTSVQPS